jgi:serine/threonine protein phosphatase PrpC
VNPLVLLASDHLDKRSAAVRALVPWVACALTPGEGPSVNPKHQANEDSLGALLLADGAAGIVADSHWGASIGEGIVRRAVETFEKHAPATRSTLEGVVLELASAASTARSSGDASATTFLVALVRGARVLWASIADSHIYVVSSAGARRVNADLPIFAGDDLEARGQPVVETGELDLERGELVLLASDGIAPEMSGLLPAEVARLLTPGAGPLEGRLRALIERARRAPQGGRDNLALVAIEPELSPPKR